MPVEPEDFGDTVDIQDDGILWMINRVIFHPRGFALGMNEDRTDLVLFGDGIEVWNMDPEVCDENALLAKFEAMIAKRRDMAAKTKAQREDADRE